METIVRPLVLVIDDSEDFLWLVPLSLKGNYEVATAANMAKASEVCTSRSVSLIVCDYHFSSYTGIDVIQMLRSSVLGKNVPVVIFSSDPRAAIEAKRIGFEFVDKIELSKLKATVDHYFAGGNHVY